MAGQGPDKEPEERRRHLGRPLPLPSGPGGDLEIVLANRGRRESLGSDIPGLVRDSEESPSWSSVSQGSEYPTLPSGKPEMWPLNP